MKVDFIGVGAQKSGTSWLYTNLEKHPQVCVPKKEIHFFSRDRNWRNGYEWYEDQFNICNSNTVKGEFSTSYLYDEATAKKIYDRFPNVKIIMILRDPVKRAYSNYQNDIKAGRISYNIDFDKALKEHDEYLEQGYYYKQISEYFKYFQKEQILILLYEDILKCPTELLSKVYSFLSVDDSFVPEGLEKKVNESRIPQNIFLEKLITKIAEYLESGKTRALYSFLKGLGIHNLIRKINTKKKKTKLISKKDYDELSKLFIEDKLLLEEFIDRKIEEWKY